MGNNVKLTYNPYKNESKITINEQTVSPYGEIANYLKEPFSKWYMKILDVIARELNDDFSMTFTSGLIETLIMRGIAEKNENCIEFKEKPFSFNASIYERTEQLAEELYNIGFSTESVPICNCNIWVLNEEIKKYISDKISGSDLFDKIGQREYKIRNPQFYNIICRICEISEECIPNENEINIVINTSEYDKTRISRNGINVDMNIGSQTSCNVVSNTEYQMQTTMEQLYENIVSFIGYVYINPCFIQAMSYFKNNANTYAEEKIKMLDAIEPIIKVEFKASSMEIGQRCPIKISTIPQKADLPEFDVKVSNPSVLKYENNAIYACGSGNSLVEVCLKGTIEPIFQTNVTVVKLNRIQSIDISSTHVVMGVGETHKIDFSYTPKDAMDVNEIRFTSSNINVAEVDDSGQIRTLSSGVCKIIVSTSQVECYCDIEVKPRTEKIDLSTDRLTLLVGQEKELIYSVWPLDSIDKNVEFKISDESILSYDGNNVKGKSFGHASITIYNPHSGQSATCEVEVKSTLNEKNKLNPFKILSFILFAVSLITLNRSMIGLSCAVGGIIAGGVGIGYEGKLAQGQYTMLGTPKKPEIFGCILGIILNIVSIIISVYV